MRISPDVQKLERLSGVKMTKGQKFRRVLSSRYGVLSPISLIVGLSLFYFSDIPEQGIRAILATLTVVVTIPIAVWSYGSSKFDTQYAIRRLEENPILKRELKEGESLIDFLYEDAEKK